MAGKNLRVAAFEDYAEPDLAASSADHAYMCGYWDQTEAILGGIKAMQAHGETYLPKHPYEDGATYNYRKSIAKMTNVFSDIVEDLSSRPFAQEVKIGEGAPIEIENFCEDVDGSGNDITAFASQMFYSGVSMAIDWIFVDFPVVPPRPEGGAQRTRADDQREGIRPYWSHVVAQNVLEVRSKISNGKETLVYMRIREPAHDGVALRIRIMEASGGVATWTLWEKNNLSKWAQVDQGSFSIGVIPLTPFITGRRFGKTWKFDPTMKNAGDLQVQLYRDESNLNHAKVMTAFPMISAAGVKPTMVGVGADAKVVALGTGPGAVLYAPTDGKGNPGQFTLMEPSATSLTFLQTDIDKTINNLRELGRQPLTAQSGNITVVTAGVAAMKGNSAVKAWAINAGLTLENALALTALWLRVEYPDPKANLFTDFEVDGQADQITALSTMRAAGDLSQRTLWDENKRRGVLSPDFDADAEIKRLLDETPADEITDPATGAPGPDGLPAPAQTP